MFREFLLILKSQMNIYPLKKKIARIEKRNRFAITTIILSLLMVLATFFLFDKAIIFIPLLIVISFILTYFSLLEGIEGFGWFGLFFMTMVVTVSSYLFYFLFPARWLTRLPFIFFYGISIYATLLCANIFNVGVEKNLALYRAAFSVNFLFQAIVSFLFFNLLFSFQQDFIINIIIVGAMSFLLSLHLFWTIRLKKSLEKENLVYAILVAVVLSELALVLSFIPLKTTIYALFLTGVYYSLSGLIYNYLDQRLFKETIREYIIVLSFVFVITLLSISW